MDSIPGLANILADDSLDFGSKDSDGLGLGLGGRKAESGGVAGESGGGGGGSRFMNLFSSSRPQQQQQDESRLKVAEVSLHVVLKSLVVTNIANIQNPLVELV